jgi:hypothetical protein
MRGNDPTPFVVRSECIKHPSALVAARERAAAT